ncbi:hypothetical protein [uncultured Sulfitobacter sp.]|uniref:hypothetical protein n=1 Tax=uncultured Sulfitobacter sp. TaxID=191468 RepID=UPI0030DA2ED2|tara:strand:+ start:13126 stop:14013 length:888 start_codon:yes stop_codon:yes gene_type:complete
MSVPNLSIFFVVDPPKYQDMGCYLAASIRTHFDEDLDLIGYCPAETIADMDPYALAIYKKLNVDIRPIDTAGVFDPPYPHGNKMVAAMQPRRTPYSAFMDSDMLFIGANTSDNIIKSGHVSVAPATSMMWSGQDIWPHIYSACDMPLPEERIWLSRQRRKKLMPYFNAGLIVFPEGPVTDEGETFVEVWMRLAQIIDQVDLIKKRPYLDQMSLPLAIRAAALDWNILPEEQHYILGGKLRGKPLPDNMDIKMIHYRNMKVLKEVGMLRKAKSMLEQHVGERRFDKIDPEKLLADG